MSNPSLILNSGETQQKVAAYVIDEVSKIPENLFKSFRC